MLKILGSLYSPFTRIVRVTCEELGLVYEMDLTPPFSRLTPEDDQKIIAHNPLMKIPVLTDEDLDLFDSQVIVRYLLKKFGHPQGFAHGYPSHPHEENTLTVIYGILDAGILRFVMQTSHPEVNPEIGFLGRSRDRMKQSFEWLDRHQSLGQSFGLPEVALLCSLEWLQSRKVANWDSYGNLVRLHSQYKDRPSLVQTRIPTAVS